MQRLRFYRLFDLPGNWKFVVHDSSLRAVGLYESNSYGLHRLDDTAWRIVPGWMIRVWLRQQGNSQKEINRTMSRARYRALQVAELLGKDAEVIREQATMKLRRVSDEPETRQFALHSSWFANAGLDDRYHDLPERFKRYGYGLVSEWYLRTSFRRAGLKVDFIDGLLKSAPVVQLADLQTLDQVFRCYVQLSAKADEFVAAA